MRKKRQRDAVASSEGTWNFAQHRRVIHQAKFAAECMSRCRAVYAVLVAHRLESGGIASELWGSAPWVENCLLYTSPSPRDATLSRMPSSA